MGHFSKGLSVLFSSSSSSSKSPKPEKLQRVKGNREWVMGGTNTKELDYSNKDMNGSQDTLPATKDNAEDLVCVCQSAGSA